MMWRYLGLILVVGGAWWLWSSRGDKTGRREYDLKLPESAKITRLGNGPDWIAETDDYSLIVKEFPKEEAAKTILGLVPQNTEGPITTKTIQIKGRETVKAMYKTVNLGDFYRLGDSAPRWTSWMYVVQLPHGQLSLYFSSQKYDDVWAENNILGNLMVIQK